MWVTLLKVTDCTMWCLRLNDAMLFTSILSSEHTDKYPHAYWQYGRIKACALFGLIITFNYVQGSI